jgi:tetratricopeptide (TPR) repeat protein
LVFKDALKDLGWKPGDTTAGARKETATPASSVQPAAAAPAPVASADTQSFAPPEPAVIDDVSDIPDDVEPADIAEEPELESDDIEVEGIEAADELVSADQVANAAEPVEKANLVGEGGKANNSMAQQPPVQRGLTEIHEEREGMLEIFELDAQRSLTVPVEAFVSSPPAVTMPPQPSPIPLPPAAPPTPPGKGRKFVDTIAPEDSRGTELADLMTQMKGGGGFLEKTARGDQRNFLFDSYNRLAEGYTETGNYKEAQLVYERILVLRLHDLGPSHVDLVTDFRNLAGVLCTQEKFDKAEPFLRRAVSILETAPDQELNLADSMMFLANIYLRQSKFSECEPLLRKSLQIRERLHPSDHMEIADTMFDFARLYRKTGRIVESELMYTRAKEILAKNQARDAW